MKTLHAAEDIAVRVMYFFNVIDSFLPFSVSCFLVFAQMGYLSTLGFPPVPAPTLYIALSLLFLYACCRLAEFHVGFLVVLPVVTFFAARATPSWGREATVTLVFFFVLSSIIQIVFMGAPMALAARNPVVALRMYLNSFLILAPTTISLPVTLGYQFLLISGLRGAVHQPVSTGTALICGLFLGGALLTRVFRKRAYIPPSHHPTPPEPAYKRAILLNVDGLSHHAFKKAQAPFLHQLERNFASPRHGARTVYKAFTNPAFASILSGAEPERHRVFNNNFGQSIKTQALPDIITTRLYGSMHVKHFSRREWNVTVVSLVELFYSEADTELMSLLKQDLKQHSDVKLWVVDLSMADYCGHAWGSYSRQYYEAIKKLDGLIEEFFRWCAGEMLLEDTLFVISSDHGLFIGEHAYLLFPQEEFVPLIFVGSKIGREILPEKVSIIDIAANISYLLGQPYCQDSRGRVFPQLHGRESPSDFASRLGLTIHAGQG